MTTPHRPIIYLIAGSNGSGKTTFATEFFPKIVGDVTFINADLIAQGLSPFSPETVAAAAGRAVLKRIRELSGERSTFAVETTLSGRTYANLLRRMKADGYDVHLYFLWIPNSRLAIGRIKARVRRGGHNIPTPTVRRRFYRALRNLFETYYDLADYVMIFDNSGLEPRIIAEKREGPMIISDAKAIAAMRRDAQLS
jgi:predicted ABC-type ATPase